MNNIGRKAGRKGEFLPPGTLLPFFRASVLAPAHPSAQGRACQGTQGHGDTPAVRHTHRLQSHLGPLFVPCPGLAALSLRDDLILVLAIRM